MNSRQITENIEEFTTLKLRQDLGQYGLDPREWNVIQDDRGSKSSFAKFLIRNLKDHEVYFVGFARKVRQRLKWQEIRFDMTTPLIA